MRTILRIDIFGKIIIWDNSIYSISVNDISDATFIALWYDGKRVGALELVNTSLDYIKVSNVSIQKKHRGMGLSRQLFRLALIFIDANKKGLCSYLPDRYNKKQIPKLYKRFNSFVNGDFEYITR